MDHYLYANDAQGARSFVEPLLLTTAPEADKTKERTTDSKVCGVTAEKYKLFIAPVKSRRFSDNQVRAFRAELWLKGEKVSLFLSYSCRKINGAK